MKSAAMDSWFAVSAKRTEQGPSQRNVTASDKMSATRPSVLSCLITISPFVLAVHTRGAPFWHPQGSITTAAMRHHPPVEPYNPLKEETRAQEPPHSLPVVDCSITTLTRR